MFSSPSVSNNPLATITFFPRYRGPSGFEHAPFPGQRAQHDPDGRQRRPALLQCRPAEKLQGNQDTL